MTGLMAAQFGADRLALKVHFKICWTPMHVTVLIVEGCRWQDELELTWAEAIWA